MITQKSLDAATPLARELASRGVVLRPLSNTPLEALTREALSVSNAVAAVAIESLDLEAADDDSVVSQDPATRIREASTTPDVTGVVQHDEILQTHLSMAVKGCKFALENTQSVVVPMIDRVHAAVRDSAEATILSSQKGFNIIPFNWNVIWENPTLLEAVSQYSVPVGERDVPALKIPRPENLGDSLSTGSSLFDAAIQAFADDMGHQRIGEIWETFFGPTCDGRFTYLSGHDRSLANSALIAHLFARNYFYEKPTGIAMEDGDWKSVLSWIVAYTGNLVYRAIKRRESDLALKLLVLKYDRGSDEITVNGPVYNEWLEQGGTPEALMGGIIQGKTVVFSTPSEDLDVNQKVWSRHMAVLRNQASADMQTLVVHGLAKALRAEVEGAEEGLLPLSKEEYFKRIGEELARISVVDITDVYKLCRRTVCNALFSHTDASLVLQYIDDAATRNEGMELREAAFIGFMNYVADWLATQVHVDRF